MRPKLKELLDSIHPRRTLDKTAGRADEAINTFSAGRSQITDWDEFRRCIIRFAKHVDSKILRARRIPDMELDCAWGHYSKVLHEAYGRGSGEKAAFEMVRTGAEGGLYGVLRRFADVQARKYAQNEIAARISRFWGALSASEMLKAVDEYLVEYGHLLPSELTESGAARVKMNFPQVLAEHPRMMQRLGRIGRG